MKPEIAIGTFSSLVLLVTLTRQVYLQWQDKNTRGVSAWLFAGQLLSSLGFIIYSYLVRDPVFIVANTAICLTGIAGQLVYWRNSRLEEKGQ